MQEEKPAIWDGTRVVNFLRGSFSALICNREGHEDHLIFITQMQGCVLLRSLPGGISCHTRLHCMALIKSEFSNFRAL